MPQVPELSVRAVRATAVEVPLRFVLGISQARSGKPRCC
jgi:hypothetical protein